MATKQLDFIATTPLAQRDSMMPRIHCKDGVSLSVQASTYHSSHPLTKIGPWRLLEVAFISGAAIPSDWPVTEEGIEEALSKHDHTGVVDVGMQSTSVCTVHIDKIRNFIKAHGGELEKGELPKRPDLHAEILAIRQKADAKYIEFTEAQKKEHDIWDEEICGLRIRVNNNTIDAGEAERIFLEKYAERYETALGKSHQLFREFVALTRNAAELERLDLAELRRELAEIGNRL